MKYPDPNKPVVMSAGDQSKEAGQDASPPKIEFPTDYPLKIVGDASDDFVTQMLAIVEEFAPNIDKSTVSTQASRNERFCSLRVTIRATSEEQLKELFAALKGSGRVHMVI